jgi:predicted Zn-dependent protease
LIMNFLMPACRLFLNLLGGVVILSLTCSIGRAQFSDISEQDEIQLGADAAKTVEKQQSTLQDKSVGVYVNNVGQKLAQNCNRNQLKYSFKVVNTPEINAFALPGGFVYVNRGLLEAADNESELAGVLGHEIGHVVARHSVHQMKKAMMTNMGLGALGMLLGNKSGLAAMMTKMGAQLGANAAMMKFSRDDERQADQLGLQNLYAAGYNPDGMLTFFEKLEKQSKSNPSTMQLFFSTHPNPAERVENVSRQMKELPKHSNAIVSSNDFKNMKKKLSQLPAAPKPVTAKAEP